jgi:hypothetical protein
MSEISVEIAGIIVNIIIGAFNLLVMIRLGRKQIHATLQTAAPIPKPKRKRKLTRAQKRWIMVFRYLQYTCITQPISHGYIDYLILCCSDTGIVFRSMFVLIAGFGYLGSIVLFFQARRYIKLIKARDRATLLSLGALKPRQPKQIPETAEP